MRDRGYTLIELLVVIAIIAILATMLMPVIMQAKESARMRSCVVNMKQVGSALTRYFDDHDGYSTPPSHADYKNPWILSIEPLVPKYLPGHWKHARPSKEGVQAEAPGIAPPKRVWICPGDITRSYGDEGRPYWWKCGSSYMYPGPTAYLSGVQNRDEMQKNRGKDGKLIVPRKVTTWINPRRNILLADYWFDFHSGVKVDHEFGTSSLLTPNLVNEVRRMRCINVLFLDLHCESVTPLQRDEYRMYTVSIDNPYSNRK